MLYESHIGNYPQFIDQKSIKNEKYLQTITPLHTLPKSAKKVQCTGAIYWCNCTSEKVLQGDRLPLCL